MKPTSHETLATTRLVLGLGLSLVLGTLGCTANKTDTPQADTVAKPTLSSLPDSPIMIPPEQQLAAEKSQAPIGKITGMVSLADALRSKLKKNDVLYIILRGAQAGPPVAVKRIIAPKFPLSYSIGAEDAMVPNASQAFEASTLMTIVARVSHSGNAMPETGDLEGFFAKNPTRPGSTGVDITISQERK